MSVKHEFDYQYQAKHN